jgi:hypothetical protein
MNGDRKHSGGSGDGESGCNKPLAAYGAYTYRWSRKNTKRFATLVMLLHGLRASHLDVWAGAHTYHRRAAVVLALKGAGFPIITELRSHRTANGAVTRIAYYSIPAAERANVQADANRKGMKL